MSSKREARKQRRAEVDRAAWAAWEKAFRPGQFDRLLDELARLSDAVAGYGTARESGE